MSREKQPLNITINGNDVEEGVKTDVYENYIIQTNKKLQKENENYKDELNQLQSQCDELEEDVSKEEQRRTYMKGLMHNLYDMKQKSFKMTGEYDNLIDSYNCYNDNMYKDLYSKITPELYTAIMIIPHYSIFLLFVPPIVSFMGSLIDIYQYCLITGYQLFPFIIMWFIVDEHIATKGKRVNFDYKYNDMKKTHKLSKTKINDIKRDITEIDNSCRCLDDYIDEI